MTQVSLSTSTSPDPSIQNSYNGALNALVEDEGTILEIRFDLDEPAPAGGLKVYLNSELDESLNRLWLQRIQVENIDRSTLVSGFNSDNSGIAVDITAGSTFATITLPIFNNTEPDTYKPAIFDGLTEVTYSLLTRDQVSAADLPIIERNGRQVSDYTINPSASSSLVYFADTVSQLPPETSTPTVSISASPTDLVEEDGTLTTLTINLSEPPPSGGIEITIDSDVPNSLAQFDVNAAVYDGAQLTGVTSDVSGFTVIVTEQTATIQLAPFNDDVDEGPQNITYTLQASDDYTIDSAASSVSINIEDNDGFTGPGYSEAASGDISGDRNNPTQLALVEGTNTLSATSGDGDIEYLTINVPEGSQLDSIVVKSYNSQSDGLAFIGVQSGTTFTEPTTNTNTANLLGYTLFGPDDPDTDVGENILDNIGNGFGAIGFEGALPSGDYTFWLQQASSESTDYELEFNISPAPSDPVVSLSTTTTTISEAEGNALVLNFSVDGDIPPEGITVNLEGDAARIMQQFTVAQTRFDAETGEIFYRFDNGFANNTNGNIVGGTLNRFSLEDGDPSETASNEAAAGAGFLSNFSFTITEANASITIPVIDDLIEEDDATYTYTLVDGDGYTVDESVNSATFTVTDGVVGGGGPTVGVSAEPTTLFESEQTAVTLTFTTDGEIPAEGLVVVLEGSPRAISEFDVNATNPRLPEDQTVVEGPVVSGGSIVGTDETAGSLFFRITDSTATITVPVFQDDIDEGTETLTFNLQDGEAYNVDADASAVSLTIEDVAPEPVVSLSTTTTTISEAEGNALVLNFSVDGDIPPEGITVNLEGDAARIMQQFTVAQTRFDAETGEIFYRFDNGFANNTNGNIVGGTLNRFSLEDGDPSETASNEAAAGTGFLSNFSFTITEANASITIPVIDDLIEEEDATYTYTLVDGDGYTVDSSANSTTFTVTDGVVGDGGPTVGVSAEPTTLFESEQTAVTLTFTTDGEIPAEGLVVVLEGPPRAISEFDVNATNPRLPEDQTVVEGPVVSGGSIVGTDETAGSLFFRITDSTATITVPVFQDEIDEGTETLTFNLQDGEAYNVDQNASAVSVTIEDVKPPTVSLSTTTTTISEAEGNALVLNFSVDGDIPPEGITVNLEGDAARIMQQFTVAQTRFDAETGEIFYRFDNGFANNTNGNIVGGTLNRFSLEDGDPSETASNEAAAGAGFLSNFSFTITEANASITIPVIDDLIEEEDATYTYTLVDGDGYLVDDSVNSATFTVTDGVVGGGGPTVGVSAEPTTLYESEQDAVTLTFTTDGEIPPGGVVVVLEGSPRAISEFDVNATNPRLPEDQTVVEGPVVSGGSIVGTDETAGSLFFRITDSTATITVPVFQDEVEEGLETLTFNLKDGEAYNVDADASAISVNIGDTEPVVSLSTTTTTISEAEGNALVLNFSVDGDIPPEGITVNLEGDAARIMQQFTVAQTRFDAETGEIFYRFDNGFANNTNGNIVGGTLNRFSLEDGDPSETASNEAAAGTGFLSNFSFTITEANASITIPVIDDLIEEDDATYTYTLVDGDGYKVDDSANSTTFTVTDGVVGGGGPTVGVSAEPTTLYESEQDAVTLTFTTDGEIPPEGLVVVLEGSPRAISEFDVNATNPRLPEDQTVVEGPVVNGGSIVGTDETAGSLFFRITDSTATITVPVFQDEVEEGAETLTFNLQDGEAYNVDADASAVSVTIDDVAPEVSFSVNTTTLSEEEGTLFTFSFSVNGVIPEGGLEVALGGDLLPFIDQLDFSNFDFSNPDNVKGLEIGQFGEDGSISVTLLESSASLSVRVFDDIIAEQDANFDLILLDGDGYSVKQDAKEATVTVTDGVIVDNPPTVALSVDKTNLNEGEELTVNFNVDGDVSAEQPLTVLVSSTQESVLGEFNIFNEDGTPAYTTTGIQGEATLADDTGSSFFVELIDTEASITLSVFEDEFAEGVETFNFEIVDGERYSVDATNNKVALTIDDAATFTTGANDEVITFAYDFSNSDAVEVTATVDQEALDITDADFDNLVGFYEVVDANGGVDTDGDGVADLNPGDAGYAKAALENAVDGIALRIGGNETNDTTAGSFGDAVLAGGKSYAPFAIANIGDMTVEDFLAANPNNDAATETDDQVAYFAYGAANPDGANHLKSWGDGIFGFEDLPDNLGVSDNDFNDAVFKFDFTA